MDKRKFLHLIMLIAGMLVLFACTYEKIQFEAPVPPDPTHPLSYSADIQTIWDKGCNIGCHRAGATPPDLSAANSYNALMTGGFVDTVSPAQSVIYTSMISGGSMATYTNPKDAGKVLVWIQEGAKNN
ncbi:MAG: hypothetical protein D4R67_10810 [Bacteroidetes bacterium]|nr:MAG: hypothetical protein D4R67_10810 [Bacteroidota bacterium]